MREVREEVEHNIWCQVKSGNSSFWFDNWTKKGVLYFVEGDNIQEEELKVKDFYSNGEWVELKLRS